MNGGRGGRGDQHREAEAAQHQVEERRGREGDQHLDGVEGEEDDDEDGEIDRAEAERDEEIPRRAAVGRRREAGGAERGRRGRARQDLRQRQQAVDLEQHDRARHQRRELVLVLLDEVHRLLQPRHQPADRGVEREEQRERHPRPPEPGVRVPGERRMQMRRRLVPAVEAERRNSEERRDRHPGGDRDRARDLLADVEMRLRRRARDGRAGRHALRRQHRVERRRDGDRQRYEQGKRFHDAGDCTAAARVLRIRRRPPAARLASRRQRPP